MASSMMIRDLLCSEGSEDWALHALCEISDDAAPPGRIDKMEGRTAMSQKTGPLFGVVRIVHLTVRAIRNPAL